MYAEYGSCDTSKEIESKSIKTGGNFCIDFYKYLKNKEKRFQTSIDSTELKPQFSYYELDRLKTVDPMKILNHDDRDEIYQMYEKTYKPYTKESEHNIASFYLWMINNQCVHLDTLVNKIERLYQDNNPFNSDYYVVSPMRLLYNKGLIKEIPILKQSKKKKPDTIDDRVPKNEYRVQNFRKSRVPPTKTWNNNIWEQQVI